MTDWIGSQEKLEFVTYSRPACLRLLCKGVMIPPTESVRLGLTVCIWLGFELRCKIVAPLNMYRISSCMNTSESIAHLP